MKRIIAALCAGLMFTSAGQAQADPTVTRSPATAPTLGTVIRGSSATTFSVTAAGAVSRTSGNAIRLSSSSVTTPTITINCGLLNLSGLCALRYVRVTITPVTGSGPANITRFRVASMTGATYRSGSAPAEGSTVTFDLNPLGLLSSASFKLGMDVQLAANAASGNQTFDYLVTVQFTT
ncbi:hypothetical protein [Brevundimonas sp. GCM10030266]|uniref:hypothetical protein n=1 Tax=Brevundimonas sp. GCM10030266 TaxID=3273386 RepID=UPI0036143AF4